ncbi:LysM peptidoglycan-binding domain-containing protein [Brevibacillus ruminantium]|uniref:LysM peptidoglycan-binding domain-containing protein n=1 Tax=Brevibacillus ruminantium TaxID=2950604 RepID=A0ABY4WBM0_9BACL|nr:LysM domain-containing protein [Brevibacillus ruminantium]USG63548.1 LysM peptidoglycan-binding domain-containing protein [Brevibacillus ruminantium]
MTEHINHNLPERDGERDGDQAGKEGRAEHSALMAEFAEDQVSLSQGLPPRRLRHKHTNKHANKQKISRPNRRPEAAGFSKKAVLRLGLAVFGTLFFLLICMELYKAGQSVPANVSMEEKQGEPGQTWSPDQQASTAGTLPVQAQESSPEGNTGTAQSAEPVDGIITPSAGTETEHQQNPTSDHASEQSVSHTGNTTPPAAPLQPESTVKEAVTQEKEEKAQATVKQHKVKKGETLFQLSRLYYGHNSGVKKIAGYNGISPESQLFEGQIVQIPLSP